MDHLEYYAYLAKTVPPADLARAAARRLAQRASLALRRRGSADFRELLDVFCAEDARDLAFKLAAPRASHLWADTSRRKVLQDVAAAMPGVIGRVLARAERAYERRFDVYGTEVKFGRDPIDWHLDALSGARFDPEVEAFSPDLWRDGLDPKAPWSIARMEQAVALAQGVWLSPVEEDHARFASEFTSQVRQFAGENPIGMGVNWSSPMEAALRATNLALAYLMLRHRPELQETQFALCFAAQMSAHGLFVEAHLEHTGAVPNNHYVANLVGLLHLGVIFPELPRARAWRELAVQGLREQIQRQVLADGFSFEGSTSYHRLAIELFTLGLFAADAGRIELGEEYARRLQAMYRAVRVYLAPGGAAPQFGDNDSGRALALADRAPLEHGYLLPLGAALFNDAELKCEGQGYPDEALFLMGLAGVRRYEALPASELWSSGALTHGGVYVLRSGAAYCAIACGATGQSGVGGHGHNDKLGIEIYSGDQPVIVDTGTFCYTSRPDLRNLYRSTAAHSTVQVDGVEQSRLPEGRLFALPDDARARAIHFESVPLRERFAGEHRGFERLVPPLRHRREVVFERGPRVFLVLDRVVGGGAHQIVSRFHLPDVDARLRPALPDEARRLMGLAHAADFDVSRAVEIGPAGAPAAVLLAPRWTQLTLADFHYSPGYGQRVPSLCVEIRFTGETPVEVAVAVLLV